MDCACIYVDAEETASHSWHEMRTAKKQHKCCECHRIIEKGEKYEYVFGIWDGRTSKFKTCSECISIRDAFFCEGYAYECMMGYLREHLQQTDGSVSAETLDKLTPKAREKIIGIMGNVIHDMIEDEED